MIEVIIIILILATVAREYMHFIQTRELQAMIMNRPTPKQVNTEEKVIAMEHEEDIKKQADAENLVPVDQIDPEKLIEAVKKSDKEDQEEVS